MQEPHIQAIHVGKGEGGEITEAAFGVKILDIQFGVSPHKTE